MTGGISGEDEEDRSAYTADADWTAVTLGTPLVQPAGSGFLYSNQGADLISPILVHATGRSVLDYAREKLFNPLGISTEPAAEPYVPETDVRAYDSMPGFGWATDPQGLNLGGGGLKITTPDMITLGRLYLCPRTTAAGPATGTPWLVRECPRGTKQPGPGDQARAVRN